MGSNWQLLFLNQRKKENGCRSKRHTLITVNARCKQTAQLTAKRLRSGKCIRILLTFLKRVILCLKQIQTFTNLQLQICDILWLTSILSEQARHDGLKKTTYSWKVKITDYWKLQSSVTNLTITLFVLGNTDTNSTSKHFFSLNEQCCLLATGVDMD